MCFRVFNLYVVVFFSVRFFIYVDSSWVSYFYVHSLIILLDDSSSILLFL